MNKKVIKIALVIMVLLALLGAWFWFRNVYSREVVRLEILGPSEVEAGSEVTYTVRYKNNGNIRLEEPRLVFEYPETSVMTGQWLNMNDERVIVRDNRRVEILLDDLQPGEERAEEFTAIIFGIDNTTLQAVARLEYRPRGLNVRFESETSHTLRISGVPLTFEIHLPSRAEPGTEFSFDVNYFSKMNYPLTDLRIKIEYPSEFRFTSSRPKPSFENSEWEIGVLNRGQGGRIEVSGILQDSLMEAKTFEATLGFWQAGRFIPLKKSARGIELAAPPIFISYWVNERTDYSASFGEYLYYEISFLNTGETPLQDLFMTVKLDESVLDFDSVQPGLGNFQKSTGTILWDSNKVSELRFLPSMEEGRVSFWVRAKENVEGINLVIRADVLLSNVRERINTKVNSKTSIVQEGYFKLGPFSNYGPQPPTVGSLTSYSVRWRVNNRHNNLKDAKIRATLAPGVRLSGEISPEGKNIFFDSDSREVIWDIGDISAGQELEAYFQIIFDPMSNQRGDSVELVSSATFSGMDTWTESMISSSYEGVDSTLPDDPSMDQASGIIQ